MWAGNQWLGFQRGAALLWSRAGLMPRPRLRARKVAEGHLAASLLLSTHSSMSLISRSILLPSLMQGNFPAQIISILRCLDNRVDFLFMDFPSSSKSFSFPATGFNISYSLSLRSPFLTTMGRTRAVNLPNSLVYHRATEAGFAVSSSLLHPDEGDVACF